MSAPKASAFYIYVQPDKDNRGEDITRSYGDLPGVEKSGAPLAGRKFYKRWAAKPDDIQLQVRQANNEVLKVLRGNQNQIARFVSAEDSKFRFTLRFKDLKKEELGCVLLALAPDRFKNLPETGMNPDEEYWQSLGHGRPLGMGGIMIEPECLKILKINSDLGMKNCNQIMDEVVEAFMNPGTGSSCCHQESTSRMFEIMEKIPKEQTTDFANTYGKPKQHNKANPTL